MSLDHFLSHLFKFDSNSNQKCLQIQAKVFGIGGVVFKGGGWGRWGGWGGVRGGGGVGGVRGGWEAVYDCSVLHPL